MTRLEYTIKSLASEPAWRERQKAPFKTLTTRWQHLLGREVRALGGTKLTIAVAVQPKHIKADGMLYADARPSSPAVVVELTRRDGTRLTFPSDQYKYWEDNVYAVALALEALRKVDRYGIKQGAQYMGFRALPPGAPPEVTPNAAAETIATFAGFPWTDTLVLLSKDHAEKATQVAMRRAHPDAGGKPGDFDSVTKASKVLQAHFGSDAA